MTSADPGAAIAGPRLSAAATGVFSAVAHLFARVGEARVHTGFTWIDSGSGFANAEKIAAPGRAIVRNGGSYAAARSMER
jgi:hypothetical protein